MRVILVPTAEAVIAANIYICEQGGNPHNCANPGKIESAISTAFYPGSYPFAHGGLSRVAGECVFIWSKAMLLRMETNEPEFWLPLRF